MSLGYLLFYRISNHETHEYDYIAKALDGTGVRQPAAPLPVDAYRRLSRARQRYDMPKDLVLECTVAPAKKPNKRMIQQHLVGTLRNSEGIVQRILKIGEMTFFKPPIGEPHKGRIRLAHGGPWKESKLFADYLRAGYEAGCRGAVDGTAVRRLVKNHLMAMGVLALGGPDFFWDIEQMKGLEPLFDALSEANFIHWVDFPDTEYNRAFLARGVERALAQQLPVHERVWSALGTGYSHFQATS